MGEKNRESDMEIHFKDTFRAFSKDNDGNLVKKRLDSRRKEIMLKYNSGHYVELAET